MPAKRAFRTSIGFTLVEVLVVTAAVAALAGVGYYAVTGTRQAASDTKLRSDVSTINNAIDAYLLAGGAFAPGVTPEQVLAQLKTEMSGASAQKMLGFTNAFIDTRMVAEELPVEEESSGVLRALLNNDSAIPRFYVANAGGDAIKQFVYDDNAPIPAAPDANRAPLLARAPPGGWLWEYESASLPLPTNPPAFMPSTTNTTDSLVFTNTSVTKLAKPVFQPPGADYNLGLFTNGGALIVTITSPNPPGGWAIFYATNSTSQGNTNIGNFLRLTNPTGEVPVKIETRLTAYVASFDPSRFANSDQTQGTYGVLPIQLAMDVTAPDRVSYLQASSANPPQALVYLRPNFDFQYATAAISLHSSTGTNDPAAQPSFGGYAQTNAINLTAGLWGTNTQLLVNGKALSTDTRLFLNSGLATEPVDIDLTEIPLEILPENPIGIPLRVEINYSGYSPAGASRYYNVAGVAPLSPQVAGKPTAQAILYTTPFRPTTRNSFTIVAQATLNGFEQWFTSYATRSYQRVGVVATNLVGLNFSAGDLNGVVNGSIFLQAGGLANINAGSKIFGNLYVPSLPDVQLPGNASFNPVVARNAYFSYELVSTNSTAVTYTNAERTLVIDRDTVGGAEYDSRGLKVPAAETLDYRQIVDLDGVDTNSGYTLKVNSGAYVDGKIYRNGDPPPLPDVPTFSPPFPLLTNTVNVGSNVVTLQGIKQTNSVLDVAVLPTNAVFHRITMANTNGILRLGQNTSPASTNRYFFDGGNWSAGRVEILGPVEIFFRAGFTNDGVTFGSSNTIYQTVIYTTNGNVTIGKSSKAADPAFVYGVVDARSNTVTIDNSGRLYGSILATTINVAGEGQVYVAGGSR